MQSEGSVEPLVLVVGEAPGESEDAKGRPFVGQSGQLLREVLTDVGFSMEDVRFTNVVRCRPPDNKISKKAIECCSQFAVLDILKYDPKYVFLMGNSPLQGILGQSGITNWHGVSITKAIEDREFTFIPLYHPAYILRDGSHTDEWIRAMSSIAEEGGTEVDDSFELIYPRTIEDVVNMASWLRGYKWISFDTETSTLDPFDNDAILLAVSFAANGKAFSFPVDHPESWWSDEENEEVRKIVSRILLEHDGKLIGHNVKFDLMQVSSFLDTTVNAGGDTMLISHLLDSRRGIHGLKRLAGLHLGMYEYDSELDEYKKLHRDADYAKGGSMAFVPLDIMLPYSAKDAEATYRLHELLYPQLSAKQQVLYRQLIIPVSNVLTEMQINGLAIDQYVASRYEALYSLRKEAMYQEILSDKKVKRMVKDAGDENYQFNPGSSKQLSQLLFDYYRLKPTVLTPKGAPSTSSEALSAYRDKYPIVKHIRYYKLLSKMVGTYLTPCASGRWSSSQDGRVRTNYNLHGTVTGRLSSSSDKGLNLQNIPTPEKEPGTLLETLPVKNIFTHSWGYTKKGKPKGALVAFDYKGMELRVFSSLAKCYKMIDIHKSGKDFHSIVALMSMTHRMPDQISMEDIKALPKPVRYKFKWTNWTLLYGGDAFTLHRLYDVPVEEAEETVEMYYGMFPEVLEYGNSCIEFAEMHGYIESPFGRREMLPYINDRDRSKRSKDGRAAKNMPTQSAASETLLAALSILGPESKKRKLRAKLVNTVHDSILWDAPVEEIDEVVSMTTDIMVNVKDYAKVYMPKVDFSWLICPLGVDAEVGTHYGTEMSLEEWKVKYG